MIAGNAKKDLPSAGEGLVSICGRTSSWGPEGGIPAESADHRSAMRDAKGAVCAGSGIEPGGGQSSGIDALLRFLVQTACGYPASHAHRYCTGQVQRLSVGRSRWPMPSPTGCGEWMGGWSWICARWLTGARARWKRWWRRRGGRLYTNASAGRCRT